MPEQGQEPQPDQAQTGSRDAQASIAAPRVVYLKPSPRALLAAIEYRIGEGEFWIASNADLQDAVEAASGTRPSERTVSRHLSELRRERVIKTSGQPGKPIMIRLTSPARDGEEWTIRSTPERDGRDVVREAGSRQAANPSRHDSRHDSRHHDLAAAADVDLQPRSLSSDPSSSSDVAAAAAEVPEVAAVTDSVGRHEVAHVAADVAAGTAWGDPLLDAIAERLRMIGQDPAGDVVEAIASATPAQQTFIWRQAEEYPPRTTSPNYARALIESARNLYPARPTPSIATSPTNSPAAQEASGSPPRRLLSRITRRAESAALGALRRAMTQIEKRIGGQR